MKKSFSLLALNCVLALLLSACSTTGGDSGSQVKAPLEPLTCIAVLPAGTLVDKDDTINYQQARSLEKGAEFATGIMARELGGNTKAKVLTSSQVSSLAPDISGGISGMVSVLGKKIHCNGVLLTTVRRFKQREGTEFASDDPASADLHMALLHAGTGAVLWTAEIRETQESFLSNILSFERMQSRGFKWVNVEQLVEQGIVERLAACPYLK